MLYSDVCLALLRELNFVASFNAFSYFVDFAMILMLMMVVDVLIAMTSW